jgi:hypothetical protein
MSLDSIPQEQRAKFPTGVSEVEYGTEQEMSAFIDGLNYADDIDVSHGQPFQRDGKFVMRVVVGEWDDEDLDEE